MNGDCACRSKRRLDGNIYSAAQFDPLQFLPISLPAKVHSCLLRAILSYELHYMMFIRVLYYVEPCLLTTFGVLPRNACRRQPHVL